MSEKKLALKSLGQALLSNACQFVTTLLFLFIYAALFGQENMMPAIAVSVGFTMLPDAQLGIRPLTMAGIIVGLYVGSGVVAQLALVSPWLAFPFNLLFVVLILLLTGEPAIMKPSISFLLCFVFCQATPVPWNLFPKRFLGTVVFGGLVAAVTVRAWWKRGERGIGRCLKEQVLLSRQNRSYILRMSFGIAIAMFAAMSLHLKKPLWLSIVVMSLTQIEIHETVQRIKHRAIATVFGSVFFVIVFQNLIPPQYSMFAIMLLGYLSYFTPQYKHKQVVNAISAIDASLVLLDPTTAIANRFLCLSGGILIVLALFIIERLVREGLSRWGNWHFFHRSPDNA